MAEKAKVAVEEEVNPPRIRVKPVVKFQPPLMPLIDVMFTLMLFFLIATTARTSEGAMVTTLPALSDTVAKGVPLKEIRIHVVSVGDHAEFTLNIRNGLTLQGEDQLFGALQEAATATSNESPVMIESSDDIR